MKPVDPTNQNCPLFSRRDYRGMILPMLLGVLLGGPLSPTIGWSEEVESPRERSSLSQAVEKASHFELDLESGFDRELPVTSMILGDPAGLGRSPFSLSIGQPFLAAEDVDSGSSASDPFAGSPRSGYRRVIIGKCNRTCGLLSIGLGLAGVAALGGLDTEDVEQSGDVTQLLPAAGGLAVALLAKDIQGLKQWAYAGGTTMLVTHGLKNAADKARPNEGDNKSFPSGHTGAAFFGAGFIHERYGLKWGLPSYLLAAYTGLSRVHAEKHFGDDVMAGMSVGLMSNWLLTTPIDERVKISPLIADRGYGLSVSVVPSRSTPSTDTNQPPRRHPVMRYEWDFGSTEVTDNLVRAPRDSGELIDFQFNEQNDPTVSGHVEIEWFPRRSERHAIDFRVTPFELRDFGTFDEETEFAGFTFPAGEELRSGYVAYDFRARYRYELLPKSRFQVKVGGGVSLLDTLVELYVIPEDKEAEPEIEASQEDYVLLPLVHFHVGVQLSRRFLLFAEADGIDLSTDRYIDATAQVRYQMSRNWDVGLGYRVIDRIIDTGEIQNETNREHIDISLGYRF